MFLLPICGVVGAYYIMVGGFNTRLAVIEERLNTISTNELVHVQASLDRLETTFEKVKEDNMIFEKQAIRELAEIKTKLK